MVTAPNTTSPGAPTARTALGTFGAFDRISVYLTPDGIEEESRSVADIERTRIYLNDVAMITRSKRLNFWLLVPSALCVLFFGLGFVIALIIAAASKNPQSQQTSMIAALILSAPTVIFSLRILLHLINKDDVITIFGRRRKIEIRYGVSKKRRCGESHALLVAAVREANARAHELAALEHPAPPPAEDVTQDIPLPPGTVETPAESAVPPEPVVVPYSVPATEPPPFSEPVTVSDDGIFVEYNPRAVPVRPAKPSPPPVQHEPDLPFLPEIKLPPKPDVNPPDAPTS